MEGAIDTMMLYYTGMAASRADLLDESIKYYELAREVNCPEPDLYVFLKQKYFMKGDTAKGVEILEDGFKKDPDNQSILIELINYYLTNNRGEEALEYLQIAQKDDPTNLSFIFAEATLYDKLGETDKALETYNRCIEIDPDYFNAYYNIGVMYYNNAVEMYKAADEIGTPKEYGEATDAADVVLAKALPFMEEANRIDPEEVSTLETLKTLYYRMGMIDKYEEVKAKLESMPVTEESTDPMQ
jgi:tetratricopeptide (TPR) repeat protein